MDEHEHFIFYSSCSIFVVYFFPRVRLFLPSIFASSVVFPLFFLHIISKLFFIFSQFIFFSADSIPPLYCICSPVFMLPLLANIEPWQLPVFLYFSFTFPLFFLYLSFIFLFPSHFQFIIIPFSILFLQMTTNIPLGIFYKIKTPDLGRYRSLAGSRY
jgi:hypothetical protein